MLRSLLPKAAKWESLGIELSLSPDELATIKANSEDVEQHSHNIILQLKIIYHFPVHYDLLIKKLNVHSSTGGVGFSTRGQVA